MCWCSFYGHQTCNFRKRNDFTILTEGIFTKVTYLAHKAMCQDDIEENKRRCKGMKNIAKKAVLKAMRKNALETLTE